MKRLLLVLSLFGMMAHAMETVIIKDITGEQFELTQAQKNALSRCKTVKPFLVKTESVEGMEKGPIDFSKIPRSFITQANIQQLAGIIAHPEEVKKLNDDKTVLELFQLADYLMAPKEIVRKLAQGARMVISERVAQLNTLNSLNKGQTAELHDLKVAEQARENGKFDIHELMHKLHKKKLPLNTVLGYDLYTGEACRLELSDETTQKISSSKLQSLNGIQKLMASDEQGRAIEGKILIVKLDNQDIEKVDLGSLKRKFPQLKRISLKNNLVEHISETEKLRKLEVDLRDNPLKSITIQKPERCNYLTFKTDNPDVKVEFAQDRFSKVHSWLKSFWAKTKVAREGYFPSGKVCAYSLCGLALTCGSLAILNEFLERSITANELENTLVLANQKIILSDKLWDTVKGKSLMELAEQYGHDTRIVTLKEVAHLLPPVVTNSYKNIFMNRAKDGALWGSYAIAFASSIWGLTDMVCSYFYSVDHVFKQDLTNNTVKNPYRIIIKDGDAVIKEFPSNYTYNLFGKI